MPDNNFVKFEVPIAPTSIIFGDNIGKISWEDGTMRFEGNANKSAKIFFEEFLKYYVDEYIKSRKEK